MTHIRTKFQEILISNVLFILGANKQTHKETHKQTDRHTDRQKTQYPLRSAYSCMACKIIKDQLLQEHDVDCNLQFTVYLNRPNDQLYSPSTVIDK